jgi:ADP-heptose:LPS heptosyltransferase
MSNQRVAVLVQLGAGVGNIVLATPLLMALHELGVRVDLLLHPDYRQTADLLQPWSVVRHIFMRTPAASYKCVLPALPPFYQARFGRALASQRNAVTRPPDSLFYKDEQAFYLHFARSLAYSCERRPAVSLPIAPSESSLVTARTVVLAPGCKTGEMAAKRWPYFPELAAEFDDVVVVGTADDLAQNDGRAMNFPRHVRSLVGKVSLRETAEVMAAAGVVVGNDSGLSHVAAAVGAPTVMLFGPTPHATLGSMPPNVRILRAGLRCEPCWFRDRFRACGGRIDCLGSISVQRVAREVLMLLE